jgi:phospholipid/cholesterol/gamma-HCH transport system substrate-binding protein
VLSRERTEIKVGLVFVITIVLMVLGVVWGKKFTAAPPVMSIEIAFPSVGGLLKGDGVLVSGMPLGEVSEVVLRPHDVLVRAKLERKVSLYDGYDIGIAMLNFTGEMGVTVRPGTGQPIERPYGEFQGTEPFDLSSLTRPASETFAVVQGLGDTLRKLLPPLVYDTRRALSRIDTVLTSLGADVGQGRVALTRTLRDLRGTISATKNVLESVGVQVDSSAAHADVMFASLTATSDSLRNVITLMDSSNGTFRRLVTDSTLYVRLLGATSSLDSAASSLDSLATDVRENPKRYVQFSLF